MFMDLITYFAWIVMILVGMAIVLRTRLGKARPVRLPVRVERRQR